MAIFKTIENGWRIDRKFDSQGNFLSEFASRPLDPEILAQMPETKPSLSLTEKIIGLLHLATDIPKSWQ